MGEGSERPRSPGHCCGHISRRSRDGPEHAGPCPAGPDRTGPGPRARRRSARPRPLIERVGLALIAVVIIAVFGAIAAASFASGEPFVSLMAGIGALMTAWAGGLTLLRG